MFDSRKAAVYIDGRRVGGDDAWISVFDHGLLYGDGVFDGLRVVAGALFRPLDHIQRLNDSARGLGIDMPLSSRELLDAVCDTAVRGGFQDGVVRIVVTRGSGAPGMDPDRAERPTLIIMAYPSAPLLGSDPLRVIISWVARKSPRSLGSHIKSLNYLDSIFARQQAKAAGVHDAIMLDIFGAVAEATGANVFALVDDALVTPSSRASLPGITRKTVIELATQQGLRCEMRELWPFELYTAKAVFLTGSGCGVAPVDEVDGRVLMSSTNPVVKGLRAGYEALLTDPDFVVPIHGRSSD